MTLLPKEEMLAKATPSKDLPLLEGSKNYNLTYRKLLEEKSSPA
jgi:hypothetical protein